MNGSDTSEIRSIRLFAGLPEDQFQALIRTAAVQRFAPRTLLIKEGDHADFLHVLLDGSVALFAQMDEEETAITLLRPVAPFILPAVVGRLPYLASARTLRSARILMIRAEAVRSVFAADAAFARAIVCELSRGCRSLLTELKNQKLRTSTERLADWLLRANAQLGDTGRFTLPFDKRTLASRLGMTPENLSRNLKALADRGVVIHGRDVTLKDPEGLAVLARAAPVAEEAEL
jgi:CRP/FNR family transcriptional regulator, transcriptional activator FtrB